MKKKKLLLLLFVLMGITFAKSSWGQPNYASALNITCEPSSVTDIAFSPRTSGLDHVSHVFANYTQSSHTFPQLDLPYERFVINAHYTNPNYPFNTVYYNYSVNRADVVAANGSPVYYYSNGAQLTIWSTGWHYYSFRIERPVGIP